MKNPLNPFTKNCVVCFLLNLNPKWFYHLHFILLSDSDLNKDSDMKRLSFLLTIILKQIFIYEGNTIAFQHAHMVWFNGLVCLLRIDFANEHKSFNQNHCRENQMIKALFYDCIVLSMFHQKGHQINIAR